MDRQPGAAVHHLETDLDIGVLLGTLGTAGARVEQSTDKTHLIHLYRKLEVHSRTQAVARARALRLLD